MPGAGPKTPRRSAIGSRSDCSRPAAKTCSGISVPAPADRSLAGRDVLVTRPAPQVSALCRLIEAAGGRAIAAPAIEIVGPGDAAAAAAQLRADDADIAIFVSRPSVEHALALVPDLPARLGARAVFAAGPGTQAALARAGISASAPAEEEAGSEGLLRLPGLEPAAVAGRCALIV